MSFRLCAGFTFCNNAADIFYKGEALCGRCADRKYGSSVGLLAAIQLQEVRGPDPSGAATGSGPPSVPVLAGPRRQASVGAVSPAPSDRAAGAGAAPLVGALAQREGAGSSPVPGPAAPFAEYLLSGEWTLGDVEFLTELYERGER